MRRTKSTMGLAVAIAAALGPGAAARSPASLSDEARTAAYFDRIAQSPPRLRIFLQSMPKGGDLHNHNGGVIYIEDYLRWAGDGGLCIATATSYIADPPCRAPDTLPAAGIERDYARYSRAVDAMSTRGFESGVNEPQLSGYDRFFATFAAFGRASAGNLGKELAAARAQAAADRVAYVELGVTSRSVGAVVDKLGGMDPANFDAMLAAIQPALPAAIAATKAEYDAADAEIAAIDACAGSAPKPACAVALRYHYTAIRTLPPSAVFAQLAFGFAMVGADPRFVAVNIAAPEHDPVAIRDYSLHMRMIGFLKARFPQVPLSLHAGELTLGLVPPRELTSHIRQAIEVAGARRIGHGIDISYESDAIGLLRKMARERIAVEINLTSNAVILGVKGKSHPLSLYREAGVPVVLSTDDEGVSRSDMTNEYLRAVTEQGLRYRDLKQIVRDGLQYSFLPGPSLWLDRAGGPRVAACAALSSRACDAFAARSEKAAIQRTLERDLEGFEAEQRVLPGE